MADRLTLARALEMPAVRVDLHTTEMALRNEIVTLRSESIGC